MHNVAIVTGAGTGIGRACSLELLRAGYAVTLAGRSLHKLQTTRDAAGKDAERALCIEADVRDPDSVAALFAATIERWGRLDLLFNNAGTGASPLPLEDLTLEQWHATLDTNVTGTFLCTQQAFRVMREQSPMGGRIINNGSISAHVPRPNSAPYTASKHAITGLTRATALDGRRYNIACGQIDIGNADTDMVAPMRKGVPQANGDTLIEPTMDVTHVAQALLQMAQLPLESNIQFMTIMATKMPFIGRG